MKHTLAIILILFGFRAKGQEIWQLSPWAIDSNYVLSAYPSGEPRWRHKDSLKINVGLKTLNGLTNASQTFAVTNNTSGFTINSSGSTHTFNLPYEENSTSFRLGHQSVRRDNSVSLGNNAMGSSGASANNNTAIGKDVLRLAGSTGSGGTNNVGIGFQSLYSNTTGLNNTCISNYSGYNITTGTNNTAIGTLSGFTLSTQSNNTFIGYEAGRQNTGSGGVFIGNQAGRNETNSNRLYIENSDGSTPLIGGDFNTNVVGINTAFGSIARTLTVTGEMRVTDLITDTPSQIVGRDADGDFGTFTATSGQVLKYNGTAWEAAADNAGFSGTGTANKIPYFTSSTALAATDIHFNSNGLGFGNTNPLWALHLTNKAIYMQGTSTIIDANNSGGPSGEFLMATGGSGVDWQQIQLFRSTTGGGKDVTVTGGSTIANALVPNNGTAGQVLRKGTSGYDWATPTSEQYAQLYLNGSSTITANTAALLSAAHYTTLTYTGNGAFSNPQTNRIRCDFTGRVQIQIDATWQGGNGTATTHNLIVYKNGVSTTILPSITANDIALSGTQRGQHTYRNGLITDVANGDYFEFYYTAPSSTTLVIPLMTIRRIN